MSGSTEGSIFGLSSAPIFYPTEEEFKHPWKYLNSIRSVVEQHGIGVIQPPISSSWDFHSFEKFINPKQMSFVTKAQNIHQMKHRNGSNVSFVCNLRKYWRKRGNPLSVLPEVNGSILDLYTLHNEIIKRGGHLEVDKNQEWKDIARKLRLCTENEPKMDPICNTLRNHYIKYLDPYIHEPKESTIQEQNSINSPHEGYVSVKVPENSKRKVEWISDDNIVSKRRKSSEPIWSQVKSRSFTKDDDHNSKACEVPRGMKGMKLLSNLQEITEEDPDDPEAHGRDFGYGLGGKFTLQQYQKMAMIFESHWYHAKTVQQKESEYWRIIEDGEEFVQVQYGSDLDVGQHGSGFPLVTTCKDPSLKTQAKLQRKLVSKPMEYMLKSGWNVNNLSENTFLHHINESVAGLTRPMMYIGMLFSSFCWHIEDNYLYSINYVHTGQPKRWYGVPGRCASHFEKVMREHLPDLFQRNPNLLHLLITQLSPLILLKEGVPVFTVLQKAGQFVITCPRAYHAGFNIGFNAAESVNFALEDWLPFCRQACDDYRYHRAAAFPYEEFVLLAARNPDNPEISKILRAEVLSIIHKELSQQKKVHREGIKQYVCMKNISYRPCQVCGYDCYISGIICNSHPGQVACLHHMAQLCDCAISEKRLLVRIHISDLKEIFDSLDKKES